MSCNFLGKIKVFFAHKESSLDILCENIFPDKDDEHSRKQTNGYDIYVKLTKSPISEKKKDLIDYFFVNFFFEIGSHFGMVLL